MNLPLPLPFNPGSRPVFFGSRPFAFFRLRNIAQCCVIFPFFSRFPPPWESRFPPPLLPPPIHLPPPFLPVSRPPSPPPTYLAVLSFELVSDWKLSFIKLTLSDRLTRLLKLILLAHWASKLLLSLVQEQNFLAPGNGNWVFSCPDRSRQCSSSKLLFNILQTLVLLYL